MKRLLEWEARRELDRANEDYDRIQAARRQIELERQRDKAVAGLTERARMEIDRERAAAVAA